MITIDFTGVVANTIRTLENTVKTQNELIERLEKQLKDARDKEQSHEAECGLSFDLSNPNLRVFSIERVDKQTIIGYLLRSAPESANEWFLSITVEQHNKLVADFDRMIGKENVDESQPIS